MEKEWEGGDCVYNLVVMIRLRAKIGVTKNGRVKMARLGTPAMRNDRACSWL